MAKTTTVRLGGQDYTVRAFNIGELERVTDEIDAITKSGGSSMKVTLTVLGIALERAEPPVADLKSLSIEGIDELAVAAKAVFALAGLDKA